MHAASPETEEKPKDYYGSMTVPGFAVILCWQIL